jgi:hypothetical protein
MMKSDLRWRNGSTLSELPDVRFSPAPGSRRHALCNTKLAPPAGAGAPCSDDIISTVGRRHFGCVECTRDDRSERRFLTLRSHSMYVSLLRFRPKDPGSIAFEIDQTVDAYCTASCIRVTPLVHANVCLPHAEFFVRRNDSQASLARRYFAVRRPPLGGRIPRLTRKAEKIASNARVSAQLARRGLKQPSRGPSQNHRRGNVIPPCTPFRRARHGG